MLGYLDKVIKKIERHSKKGGHSKIKVCLSLGSVMARTFYKLILTDDDNTEEGIIKILLLATEVLLT